MKICMKVHVKECGYSEMRLRNVRVRRPVAPGTFLQTSCSLTSFSNAGLHERRTHVVSGGRLPLAVNIEGVTPTFRTGKLVKGYLSGKLKNAFNCRIELRLSHILGCLIVAGLW